MTSGQPEPLRARDALKTYRYLRIGMIGAVVLLAASVFIEHRKVADLGRSCWQTSISAYYYTPVRAIFVGSLMVVAFALIVYKGRTTLEDFGLNFAGMLAPVVAVAPTMDFGRCWSIVPNPLPVKERGLPADWVLQNIDNNIYALLIAGAILLGVAAGLAILTKMNIRPFHDEEVEGRTMISLAVTVLALFIAWQLIRTWDDFDTRAHGFAAVAMFAFLIVAIIVNAIHQFREGRLKWAWIYAGLAALMVAGAAVISGFRLFDEHVVLALETYEIALFAVYWVIQTVENWNERLVGGTPAAAQPAAGGRSRN